MPRYDTRRYDPPAPVASVTLRTLDRSKRVANVGMFIDSGADLTMLPSSVIDQLGLQPDPQRRHEVLAYDGDLSDTAVVECELVFLGQAFQGEYGILDAEEGLLGRDVLNHFSLVLDGPALEWRDVTNAK